MSAEIPLTQGKVAIVDDDDAEIIGGYSWNFDGHYARGYINGETLAMHRFILDALPGEYIDHINGNPLDNRRENLRKCTNSQNQMNRQVIGSSSGYKGVTRDPIWHRWYARIKINGKTIYLGSYPSPELAADAYDKASVLYFGDYARPNSVLRGHPESGGK